MDDRNWTSPRRCKKAVDLIKAGVENYEDISTLVGKLGNFYDAKEKIEEAKVQHDRNPNGSYGEESVEKYAQKVIESQLAIEAYEKEIKRAFSDKGKTIMYQKMLEIRRQERARREQIRIKENRARIAKARKEQEIKNLIFALIAAAFCLGGGGFIFTFLFSKFG